MSDRGRGMFAAQGYGHRPAAGELRRAIERTPRWRRCPRSQAEAAPVAMRAHPAGRDATILGEVCEGPASSVIMHIGFGGERIVDTLAGEQISRVCQAIAVVAAEGLRIAAGGRVLALDYAGALAAHGGQSCFGVAIAFGMLQAAAWGLGHAVTLFVACSAALFIEGVVLERVAHGLEAIAGVMLVLVGADVLIHMRRDRIRFDRHRHPDGTVHVHGHSHRGEATRDPARHVHRHRRAVPLHTLGAGIVRGLAGSAALILLALESTLLGVGD